MLVPLGVMVEKADMDTVSKLDGEIAHQQAYLDITIKKRDKLIARRTKIIEDCGFDI